MLHFVYILAPTDVREIKNARLLFEETLISIYSWIVSTILLVFFYVYWRFVLSEARKHRVKYFKTSLNALFFNRHPWGTNRREAEVPWDLQPCNTTPAARVGQQRSTSTRCPDSSSRSHSSSWTSSTGAPSCRRSALLSQKDEHGNEDRWIVDGLQQCLSFDLC